MTRITYIYNFLMLLVLHNAITLCHETIYDVSRLSPVTVEQVVTPSSVSELQNIIKSTKKTISFAGGRFSQGGQIACPNGIVIDTTKLNAILSCNIDQKTITVQPGTRWSQIQEYIDPYNLSVHVMQSYNNFTVGGSLSVNVHGRDPKGSLIKTVESIKVLLANGSIVQASREQHTDLFYASLGGYGLLGAIVEVTLKLTDNINIERYTHSMSISEYISYFFTQIYNNEQVIFHNANVYPNEFKKVSVITWYKTENNVTISQRLQPPDFYIKEMVAEQLLRRISPFKYIRSLLEPKKISKKLVTYRNYEMSYSTKSLEPIMRWPSTSILQEYFVPLHALESFLQQYRTIIQKYNVNVLNLSIRYVPQEIESILNYAPQDSFALVAYINVFRSTEQYIEKKWTRDIINAVLSVGGTYYLPYHLYATKQQFKHAYPKLQEFLNIKQKHDPNNMFTNSLHQKYMLP